MAIKPETLYSGQINAGDANYPYGSARNVAVPGDGLGTPLDNAWLNDIWGLTQALLNRAGVVPSGNADTILLSQYMESLLKITNRFDNDRISLDDLTGTNDQIVMNHILVESGSQALDWSTVIGGSSLKVLNIMFGIIRNLTGVPFTILGPVDNFNLMSTYIESANKHGLIFGTNILADQDNFSSLNLFGNAIKNIVGTSGATTGMVVYGVLHGIIGNAIDNIVGFSGNDATGIFMRARHSVVALNRISNIIEGAGSEAYGIRIIGDGRTGAVNTQGFASMALGNTINMDDSGYGIQLDNDDLMAVNNIIESPEVAGIIHEASSVDRVASINNNIFSFTKPAGSIGISANINGHAENISGNTIDDFETGISVLSSLGKNVVGIKDNLINDCDNPIVIAPVGPMSEVLISNNVIKGSGTDAISLEGQVDNLIVKNNVIDGYTKFINWVEADAPSNYRIIQDNIKAQSVDNVFTEILLLPLAEECAITVRVRILALQTNGINRAYYDKEHTYTRRTAGGISNIGSIQNNTLRESDSSWDTDIFHSGNDFGIRVKGAVGHNVDWNIQIDLNAMQIV